MALENTHNFSGDQPPTEGVSNTFAGESNPDLGEQVSEKLLVEGNRFPREHGSDSLTEEEAQLS